VVRISDLFGLQCLSPAHAKHKNAFTDKTF
jgi:hypothetical protein